MSVHNLPPVRGQPPLDRLPLFAAVYDGHRGREAARFAGELLHVKTAQRREYIKGDIGAALAGAIAELDEEFLLKAREEGLRDGSTAVAAVFAGGKLTVAHVGDSRCVLVGIDDEGHYVSEVVVPTSPSVPPMIHPGLCGASILPSSLPAHFLICGVPTCSFLQRITSPG